MWYMRNFNQGGGSRFGGNRGGGSRFGSDRGPVTMHPAVCSKCGKDCEVPFRPTGDKPIFCNDCFGANRDRGGDRGGDRFPRRDFGGRPARPSFSDSRSGGNDEVKKQLEFLGLKIDRLTKVVEGLTSLKTSSAKEKNVEVKEVLKTIKKKVAKKAKV